MGEKREVESANASPRTGGRRHWKKRGQIRKILVEKKKKSSEKHEEKTRKVYKMILSLSCLVTLIETLPDIISARIFQIQTKRKRERVLVRKVLKKGDKR